MVFVARCAGYRNLLRLGRLPGPATNSDCCPRLAHRPRPRRAFGCGLHRCRSTNREVAASPARSRPGGRRFRNACALDEPDRYFDAARAERTLQWIADPLVAAVEMARVVRAGGRVSLIDTDWSTLAIDIGDDLVPAQVRAAMRFERNRPSNIGSRLHETVQAAGLTVLARTSQTHVWTEWNPDESPAPDGCFSMESLADDVVSAGQLTPGERAAFVSKIHTAARTGQFSMSLTMFAVVASAPADRLV